MTQAQENQRSGENSLADEQHFAAARGLIREAQQDAEREEFAELQRTWLDALYYFRKAEKHRGPPEDSHSSFSYGYVLNSLRSLGQLILAHCGDRTNVETRTIRAALRDLAIADYGNEHLDEKTEAEMMSRFDDL